MLNIFGQTPSAPNFMGVSPLTSFLWCRPEPGLAGAGAGVAGGLPLPGLCGAPGAGEEGAGGQHVLRGPPPDPSRLRPVPRRAGG